MAVRVNRYWLVDASNSWQQINEYLPDFPDERIHIVFYEDFKANSTAGIRKCFEFLDVNRDKHLADTNLHIGHFSGKKVLNKTLSKLRKYSIFRNTVKLVRESFRI
ncbi:hypothetical protein RintRC_6542 [Richelia intracellularis]|nr:hypothetical protein RintRC_6542 [Richelia intracellularis]